MHVLRRFSLWAGGFIGSIALCFVFLAVPAAAAPPNGPEDCDPATERYSDGGPINPPSCINNNDNPRNAADCLPGNRYVQPTIGPAQCVNNAENPRDANDCPAGTTYREPGTNGTIDRGGCVDIPPGCPGSTQEGERDPNVECPPVPGADDQDVQCTTESGLSWIICPALDLAQQGATQVANLLDILLSVPILEANDGSAAYVVWSSMRNFANVLFIFVLFAIIFSQSASMGISAYGVKRILPKLIAAAILANLSFFLCAIAVDIFNVLGGGIRDLIIGTLTLPIEDGALPEDSADGGSGAADSITGGITAVLAGIAVVGLAGAAVVGIWIFLTTILLGLLVALLTLAARQALIIMLVIMAPIAFAAWVLPNTEKYFKKWSEMFLSALVMYPLIMLLFAGSHVASTIFASGGFGGSGAEDAVLRVLGLVIAVVPLFATPFMFKVAGVSMSKAGKMARSGANAYGKRFGETELGQNTKLRKDELMRKMGDNTRPGRLGGLGRRFGNRKDFRERQHADRKAAIEDSKRSAYAGLLTQKDAAGNYTSEAKRAADKAAGIGGEQGSALAQARALVTLKQEENKDRDLFGASLQLEYGGDGEKIKDHLLAKRAAGTLSSAELRAGVNELTKSGGARAHLRDLMEDSEFMGGYAGESAPVIQQRYDAMMEGLNDKIEVVDEKMPEAVGFVANGVGKPARAYDPTADANWNLGSAKLLKMDNSSGKRMREAYANGQATPKIEQMVAAIDTSGRAGTMKVGDPTNPDKWGTEDSLRELIRQKNAGSTTPIVPKT